MLYLSCASPIRSASYSPKRVAVAYNDLENNNALLGVWTDKLNMTVDAILNWEKLVFMI